MKISVYITSYNQKAYLREAIDSVLNQTLQPFEILIIDDCSTDGSQALIQDYELNNQLVRGIYHNENKGVSQVRITALQNIKGDYVTYVDGDDLYLPNKLEIESSIIKKSNCNLVFSNNHYVTADDTRDIKWTWIEDKNIKFNQSTFFLDTLTRNFPRNSLFRMELVSYDLLKKTGFHDTNLRIYEDYDLRIRLSKEARFGYSTTPTTKIRISKQGLSKSHISEHIKAFEYIFKKYDLEINTLEKDIFLKIETFQKKTLADLRNNKKSKSTINMIKNKFFKKLKKIF